MDGRLRTATASVRPPLDSEVARSSPVPGANGHRSWWSSNHGRWRFGRVARADDALRQEAGVPGERCDRFHLLSGDPDAITALRLVSLQHRVEAPRLRPLPTVAPRPLPPPPPRQRAPERMTRARRGRSRGGGVEARRRLCRAHRASIARPLMFGAVRDGSHSRPDQPRRAAAVRPSSEMTVLKAVPADRVPPRDRDTRPLTP